MPNVVVVGGAIVCPHQGKITFVSGDASLEISGSQVIATGAEAGLSFSGPPAAPPCPYLTPSGTASPCAATQAATSGVSTVLIVGGAGALTDAATGPVVNPQVPGAMWTVSSAGQSVVEVSQ